MIPTPIEMHTHIIIPLYTYLHSSPFWHHRKKIRFFLFFLLGRFTLIDRMWDPETDVLRSQRVPRVTHSGEPGVCNGVSVRCCPGMHHPVTSVRTSEMTAAVMTSDGSREIGALIEIVVFLVLTRLFYLPCER